MITLKFLNVLTVCVVMNVAAENPADEMLREYSGQNFSIAKKLDLKQKNTPEGKLVSALCLIHDKESKDIPRGFKKTGGTLQRFESA